MISRMSSTPVRLDVVAASTQLAASTARDVNGRWEGLKSARGVVESGVTKAVADARKYLQNHPTDEPAKSSLESVVKLEEEVGKTLQRGDSLGPFARTSELERGDVDSMLSSAETRLKDAKGLVEREQKRYEEFLKSLMGVRTPTPETKPEGGTPK